MSRQEILERAINKAIDNGFDKYKGEDWLKRLPTICKAGMLGLYAPYFIFNHDFAKAFFGESWLPEHDEGPTIDFAFPSMEPWKWHLQQMVIADDPIKYLGDHLDG